MPIQEVPVRYTSSTGRSILLTNRSTSCAVEDPAVPTPSEYWLPPLWRRSVLLSAVVRSDRSGSTAVSFPLHGLSHWDCAGSSTHRSHLHSRKGDRSARSPDRSLTTADAETQAPADQTPGHLLHLPSEAVSARMIRRSLPFSMPVCHAVPYAQHQIHPHNRLAHAHNDSPEFPYVPAPLPVLCIVSLSAADSLCETPLPASSASLLCLHGSAFPASGSILPVSGTVFQLPCRQNPTRF